MKKMISYICLAAALMTAIASVHAADPGLAASRFWGTITNISDNTITISDSKGNEKRLEVRSVIGIAKGMTATCEEDCGRVRVGDQIIRVQRVLSSPEAGNKRLPPVAPH